MKTEARLALGSVVLLLIGFSVGTFYTYDHFDQKTASLEQRIENLEQGSAAPGLQAGLGDAARDFMTVFEQVDSSVVSITTYGQQASEGTGFVYRSDGYIVTNQHVVEGATQVDVTLSDGSVKDAEVVGTDAYSDLAVLKVDAENLPTLELANSSEVRVVQPVFAVGNPFRLSSSVTAGIISQKNRLLQTEDQFSIPNVLQTDAAINPGNSGGPLLNKDGEVIGVNTAIQSSTGTFAGIGFAVPSNTVKRVVPSLIENGTYRHSWIGVTGRDLTPRMREAMGLGVESGFMILSTVEGSPAAKAGLAGTRATRVVDGREVPVGGDVIVALDGKEVRGISDILNYLAENTSPGDTIDVTVIRNDRRQTFDLTLSSRSQR